MNSLQRGVVTCLTLLASLVVAAGPLSAEDAAAGKLRILLTFGGHGFEEKQFFNMFETMAGVTFTKADMPKSADLLKPGLEKDYDCLVMYDMVGAIKPEQQQAFQQLLQTGIGVVSLHHNLGAHRDWPEYTKIIGGKFIFAPQEFEGRSFKPSTWSHDEDLAITVADKDHPVTKGIENFTIHDETYKGYYTASNVKVLLKTDHPKNNAEILWVSQYGKSRVMYLMLGHDSHAWANPNYPKLVSQGIRWAAGK